MFITNVTPYYIQGKHNAILVRVDTDEGVSGWGECSPMNVRATASMIVHDLKPMLIGRHASDISALARDMLKKNYKISGQLLSMAISGIEIALWDILGKSCNKPLYALLGGKVRDKIHYYGSSMSRDLSPEAEADKLQNAIDKFGFRAVKFKLGVRMGNDSDVYDLRKDVERVRTIRKRLGDDILLFVDGNSSYSVTQAIWLYERIKEFDIALFEEPCPYTDIDAYRQLYARTNAPVNLGEQEWNLSVIRNLFTEHASQYISCDVTKAGGVSAMSKISSLCEAFGLSMIPHNTSRGLGHLATMHLVSSLQSCDYYQEYSIQPTDAREQSIINTKAPKNGMATPDDLPGIGAMINEEWIMKEWVSED